MGFRMLAAAAIAALAILGGAGGATASNSDSWTDPAGDSASAADLIGVAVSNDDAGSITFNLTYANRPAGLGDDDQIQVWMDSDDDINTGGPSGFDYILVLEKGGAFMVRSTSTGTVDTPSTTLTASADGRTVSVNRSEVGNTAKMVFFVRALAKSDKSSDEAPDSADQIFVYYVVGPKPTEILYVFSAKTPKAGKTFAVAVPLVKLEDGSAAVASTLTCNATLNGKALKATAKPLRCSWRLPKSAKGKRLVITIGVTNNGSKGSFGPWRLKVR